MTRSLMCATLAAAILVLTALPVLATERGAEPPGGRDRSAEPHGREGRGASPSDPDGDSNGGEDKPEGDEGRDDRDGNNGCGNDADFEDDNNGNCGGPGRELPPDDQAPAATTREGTGEAPARGDDATTSGTAHDETARSPATDARPETVGDGTTFAALVKGVVAFLQEQQLSRGLPSDPPQPTGSGSVHHDDALATAGEAPDGTTADEVLRTALGAVALLASLTVATLGAGSLLVGRPR